MQIDADTTRTAPALPEVTLPGGMVLLPYRPAHRVPATAVDRAPRRLPMSVRIAAVVAMAATAGSASAQTLVSLFR